MTSGLFIVACAAFIRAFKLTHWVNFDPGSESQPSRNRLQSEGRVLEEGRLFGRDVFDDWCCLRSCRERQKSVNECGLFRRKGVSRDADNTMQRYRRVIIAIWVIRWGNSCSWIYTLICIGPTLGQNAHSVCTLVFPWQSSLLQIWPGWDYWSPGFHDVRVYADACMMVYLQSLCASLPIEDERVTFNLKRAQWAWTKFPRFIRRSRSESIPSSIQL